MARAFDGTNDNVDFGSDASIDGFSVMSIVGWVNIQTPAANADYLMSKVLTGGNTDGWAVTSNTNNTRMELLRSWSGALATWYFTKPANGRHHIAWTYDGGATTNDPVGYLNGVSQTIGEATAPSGTLPSDATNNLRLGEDGQGGSDAQCDVGWFTYHNAILDAAAVNRCRWWGRPHGGMQVYHPLVTDKLANEGSATANGTATGSVMVAMAAPVQRPGSAMMGMGVGW